MPFFASLLDPWFVCLLAAVGLSRFFWPLRGYVLLGAITSALVIGFASPVTLVVIASLVLLVIYPVHRITRLAAVRGWSPGVSTAVLVAGITVFVALLVLVKLQRHFPAASLRDSFAGNSLLAVVGFSYFVFRAIGFLHVQTILKNQSASPALLLYFHLFPATITSGPIQKSQDFFQQVVHPAPLTLDLIGRAIYRITRGYFRKLVVAFFLNEVLQRVLAGGSQNIVSSLALVILLYLFFYFDFAGYSDVAIGFGLLMGIKVPENFRQPFLATTVSEFWRNWHITLVDWLRDNVFIPLGGMQASRLRAAALAFFVMLLCGAWHGLTVSFLAWGAWHGAMLFIEGIAGARPVPPSLRHGLGYWSRVLWTNASVALPCVFFLPSTESTLTVLRGFVNWRLQ